MTEFFTNLVKDLLKADNTLSVEDLYTHCKIIGEHNGFSERELRDEWEELVKLKGDPQ